uniref:RING finger and transmembrane domain-containing protein 2-like n=1 Tax=Castor canadensis TaxID=51338 RepID=A0A8B7UHY6_CASCN|nr:RING finger and transmembrane domain-containing protein 2-like [Castor canadensis]
MWLLTVNQGLRKMQRRHSSNTDSIPPERGRSQVISPEASVDEGGVFESLKAESASPPAIFSGLPASPFPAGLVLGSGAGGGDVFIPMPAPREEAGGRGSEASTYHHRQPHHHFHHGGHRGSLLQHVGADHRGHGDEGGDEQPGTPAPALSELKAVICWLQRGLPFILILLAKVCFQHKLGIAVCIGMASTFAYANATLREQVSLKEKRSVLVILWLVAFLAGNTLYVLYTSLCGRLSSQENHHLHGGVGEECAKPLQAFHGKVGFCSSQIIGNPTFVSATPLGAAAPEENHIAQAADALAA